MLGIRHRPGTSGGRSNVECFLQLASRGHMRTSDDSLPQDHGTFNHSLDLLTPIRNVTYTYLSIPCLSKITLRIRSTVVPSVRDTTNGTVPVLQEA